MDRSFARRVWQRLETYHAVVYFAPDKKEAYAAAGLKGGWMGYFAGTAAPLGAASAELVTAAFYNFAPAMVRRSLPDAWSFSTPERVLDARLQIVDRCLRRVLTGVDRDAIAVAADACLKAVACCELGGHALFAANAALDVPELPHLRLWHAATMLRENRGDGHVAALVAAGLDGCEAHLTLAASGATTRSELQPNRGWSDEEWDASRARLLERGLLAEDGTLTREGTRVRRWVEDTTDDVALRPWRAVGEAAAERALSLLEEPVRAVAEAGAVPFPNPMGLPSSGV